MRDINFRVINKSRSPVYKLSDQNREPRTAEDCTITAVNKKSVEVTHNRDEDTEPRMTEFTGYTFTLSSLLSVELLPESAHTE